MVKKVLIISTTVSYDSLHHKYSLILFELGALCFSGLQNHIVSVFQQW